MQRINGAGLRCVSDTEKVIAEFEFQNSQKSQCVNRDRKEPLGHLSGQKILWKGISVVLVEQFSDFW